MSLAILKSRAIVGIKAPLVNVEVHLANGLPGFSLVGLPETSVKEAKERVRSALLNSGFEFPARRITVNLAPADLPKGGGRFDLAIAIGIIAASGQIPQSQLEKFEFYGELALSGELRPVSGIIPSTHTCHQQSRQCILPTDNGDEACLIEGAEILTAATLLEVYHHLVGQQSIPCCQTNQVSQTALTTEDLQDVVGQLAAKRALEIAAAGQHNLLFLGPPGTGKTMLASRLAGILPPMDDAEALETAAIYSVLGKPIDCNTWKNRRYRQPHHTSSAVALVGGGSQPRPGEISLANNGVLFLDELPEFERKVLDVLREPLESGVVNISRAANQAEFPAKFQLVAAMNPSPTGHLHDGRCTREQILRYLNRISGPFLDRIDLQVDVPKLPKGDFATQIQNRGESSAQVRKRVINARQYQFDRSGKANATLSNRELDKYCGLSAKDRQFLHTAVEKLGLSLRAYHRVLKVARTIADLNQTENVLRVHLAEALNFRAFDRLLSQLTQ